MNEWMKLKSIHKVSDMHSMYTAFCSECTPQGTEIGSTWCLQRYVYLNSK